MSHHHDLGHVSMQIEHEIKRVLCKLEKLNQCLDNESISHHKKKKVIIKPKVKKPKKIIHVYDDDDSSYGTVTIKKFRKEKIINEKSIDVSTDSNSSA